MCILAVEMTGRYRVTIGEESLQMTVLDGEQLRVVLDGESLELDVRALGNHRWSVLLDNRSLVVSARRKKDKLEVAVNGVPAQCQLIHEYEHTLRQFVGQGEGSGSAARFIEAPIAGKIVKVLVKQGDAVAVGDSLCVLEAMKMENEIKAESAGTVQDVFITDGDTVSTGDNLFEIS